MITSPCIGYCRIDEVSGLCAGCARTKAEIAAWRDAPAAVREQIWTELPDRRTKLGIGLHSLGWNLAEIHSFISGTLQAGGGTWVFGVYGALAEFCIVPEDVVDLSVSSTRISAATSRGAVCFELSEQVRALTLATTIGSSKTDVVVLAMPRARVEFPRQAGLMTCGPDREAIQCDGVGESLYDFGLNIGATGFCVRTADSELKQTLNVHIGSGWHTLLAGAGGHILRASPTRVVRSPVGRVEVYTRIPPPGGDSPAGPHTHFLPPHLSLARETPPGIDLPAALVPCAILYPTWVVQIRVHELCHETASDRRRHFIRL